MDGIELMAGAMHAAQTRLDVSASNLANVSSAGFRRRIAQATLSSRGISVSTRTASEQGPLERTGRAFDLSAVGGRFAVRDARGKIAYERSTSFSLDGHGRLVSARGATLVDTSGTAACATPNATIDARGVVRGAADEDARPTSVRLHLLPGTTIESGFLERSNVDAIHEMVDIMSAQRAFETAEKTLAAVDETRAKDVNDVVRVK